MPDVSSMFEELRIAFAEAVVSCRADSNEKSVHAVRTGTRRLEALLRKVLEDHRRAAGLRREGENGLKQLNVIRKLAGSVRDLDVQRKLVEEVKGEMSARRSAAVRAEIAKEYERLDGYLKRRRRRKSDALREGLTKSELKVERAMERTARELASLTAASPTPLATARAWTRRSDAEMRRLDQGNLHEYRKRTKAARYVAELQKTSAAAKRLAKELRGMQDAIGEWHDWDLLAELAKEVLGDEAAMVGGLMKKRDASLGAALQKTRGERDGAGGLAHG
jgi:CHAD domain-containing protein